MSSYDVETCTHVLLGYATVACFGLKWSADCFDLCRLDTAEDLKIALTAA